MYVLRIGLLPEAEEAQLIGDASEIWVRRRGGERIDVPGGAWAAHHAFGAEQRSDRSADEYGADPQITQGLSDLANADDTWMLEHRLSHWRRSVRGPW